jgi:ABC-2 type transport system ATP-binding protein
LIVRREIVAPCPPFCYHRIKVIEGYTTPDSGSVTALGLDPRKDGYKLKEHTGIMLRGASPYLDLRADELLPLSTQIP